MKTRMKKGFGCGCAIFILNILLGGICTQYTVNFWGTKIKKEPVHAPFVPCAVAGLFLGELTIPIAAVTWVLDTAHVFDSRR